MKDNTANILTEGHFKDAAAKLNEWTSQGKKVLVHCREGKSRSVSVVIAYYMIYRNWSFDIAYWHLKTRRPMTNPYFQYVPILRSIGAKEPYVHLDR
jgi:protein-tyrosine phosphatase